jgi:anthranilate phosphoribosyltransferase
MTGTTGLQRTDRGSPRSPEEGRHVIDDERSSSLAALAAARRPQAGAHVGDLPEPDDWAELTHQADKPRRYREDLHFLEGWASLRSVFGERGAYRFLREVGLLWLRPDLFAGGRVDRVVAALTSTALRPVAGCLVQLDRHAVRSLWQYELARATLERLLLLDAIAGMGQGVLLLCHAKDCPGGVTRALTSWKGDNTPVGRPADRLRSLAGSPNRLLTMIHSASDEADLVRELAVFGAWDDRQDLLAQAVTNMSTGATVDVEALCAAVPRPAPQPQAADVAPLPPCRSTLLTHVRALTRIQRPTGSWQRISRLAEVVPLLNGKPGPTRRMMHRQPTVHEADGPVPTGPIDRMLPGAGQRTGAPRHHIIPDRKGTSMSDRRWPQLLTALIRGEDLKADDTAWVMEEVIKGDALPSRLGAFLVALRAKGETAEELAGLAQAIVRNALPVNVRTDAVDIVGTGGDQAHTVNISTMAAIVVAGAGVPVVKHGGRAVSSACGSADVLSELGIPLDTGPEEVERCVAEAGIGFCFAPRFHAGLRHAAPTRRELGVPTAINFVAPLTNPAQPRSGAVGCADVRMARVLAETFAHRGSSVLVVRGEDGLDEVTVTAPTRIWDTRDGRVNEQVIDMRDFGIRPAALEDLTGGDATHNAAVVRRVLAGERGAIRDAVVVNAAAAIVAHEGPGDLTERFGRALGRAEEAIDSGLAERTLAVWVEVANRGTTRSG